MTKKENGVRIYLMYHDLMVLRALTKGMHLQRKIEAAIERLEGK